MAKPLGLLLALVIAIASLSVVTLLRPKPPADHYQLLGVGRSAERQEISSPSGFAIDDVEPKELESTGGRAK